MNRVILAVSLCAALAACSSNTEPLGAPTRSEWTPVPTAVAGGLTFVQISAGDSHTCGVTTDGAAYCWGDNQWAQLGAGTKNPVSWFDSRYDVPTLVLGGLRIRSISAGSIQTCALTDSGEAYCWGSPAFGQPSLEPVRVITNLRFTSISIGDRTTCALTQAGEAYCWGSNDDGDLGIGTTDFKEHASPERVAGGRKFTALSRGLGIACGTTSMGIYCWGSHWGAAPALVTSEPLEAIDAGDFVACGIAPDGTRCWGANEVGQLGRGTVTGLVDQYVGVGTFVASLGSVAASVSFSVVSSGTRHVCAIATSGFAYCWGANGGPGVKLLEDGRLGHMGAASCAAFTYKGTTSSIPCTAFPLRVGGTTTFMSISTGGAHTCALTAAGKAYCWGNDAFGQLGRGA